VNGPAPARLVLVTGTGTEVGKTWVAARLLESWRELGLTTAARKPAQSFDPGAGPTDAEVLGAAAGEAPDAVCPPARWYPLAMAPPMAADALGRDRFSVADLVGEITWSDRVVDVGLVEAAGGVGSPQADDGDTVALAAALRPDAVVVVADAGIGTINALRLSLDALGRLPVGTTGRGGSPVEVVAVLNRYDESSDLHRRNLAWLTERDRLPVVGGDRAGLAGLARRLAARPRPDAPR